MASIRRGYSNDFVIKNNKVGIGTSNPQESLDVVGGALQGQDLKVTGVSTQTGFSGFLRADHQIAENNKNLAILMLVHYLVRLLLELVLLSPLIIFQMVILDQN